jgi:hypothetical protein
MESYHDESRLLLKTSWISFPSFIIQYMYKKYTVSYITLIALITSNLYWARPTPGIRRNLDMLCVSFGTLHNSYIAYDSEMGIYLYMFYALGIYFYMMGWYYFNRNYIKKSIYCHVILHICANMGSTLLIWD